MRTMMPRICLLAACLLLLSPFALRTASASPVGFEITTGCNGPCLQGTIGGAPIVDGLLSLRYIGDTSNLYSFSVPNPAGSVWPNTDGQILLYGGAAFYFQDLSTGVHYTGMFLPSAGLYLSTDFEHCSMGIGSFGVLPSDPSFPGLPVYPVGLLGGGTYPTCPVALIDLAQLPATGPLYVNGWTISDAGFPGYTAVGPPLPTEVGDMVLNEQGIVSTTGILFTPQGQTISFATPAALGVGGSAPLTASASSGLPVTFSSQTPAACTVSGTTVTGVALGTCKVAADQPGDIFDITQSRDSVYIAAPQVLASFAVTSQMSQSITFSAYPSRLRVEQRVALSATASSGLPVTLTVETPRVCDLWRRGLVGLSRGTCSVAATQPGNATYSPAPTVRATLRVVGDN